MRLVLGLALAALAAAGFVVSYAGQHRALVAAPAISLRRPLAALWVLVRSRSWLAAFGAGIGGWACYVGALALAPLSLVQAVTGATFGPIALWSMQDERRTSVTERIGALAALVGILLVLFAAHHGGDPDRPSAVLVDLVVAGSVVTFALAYRAVPGHLRGLALGAASGIGYGLGDVATKAVVLGDVAVVPAALVGIAIGFCGLQLSYQRTTLLRSAGVSALFTNAIPIVFGVVLFGERAGAGGTVLETIGFALVVTGSVALARA